MNIHLSIFKTEMSIEDKTIITSKVTLKYKKIIGNYQLMFVVFKNSFESNLWWKEKWISHIFRTMNWFFS